MVRFYGWSHSEVMSMNGEDFDMYRRGMIAIMAEEQLIDINTACVPTLKQSARSRIINSLQRRANPLIAKEITHEEMARLLNG